MSVEHSILAVLSSRPCSGYDIKAEFEHKGASLYWGLSFGSIYPHLKKLEQKGLIQTVNEEQGGRHKKIYDLTGEGWIELQDWIKSLTPSRVIRDELMVKMTAWEAALPNERILFIDHLKQRKKETEEMLNYFIEWPNNAHSFISEFGDLAINYGQKILKAELEWIEETIEHINQPAQPPTQDPFGMYPKIKDRRDKALKEIRVKE